MVLSTPQESLHLRAGNEIWNLNDPKLCLRVTEIERRGPFRWVSGIVEKGKEAALLLDIDDVLDFGPQDPNWDASLREFAQMSTRLATRSWTHSEAMPAPSPSTKPRPSDLLAALERMV